MSTRGGHCSGTRISGTNSCTCTAPGTSSPASLWPAPTRSASCVVGGDVTSGWRAAGERGADRVPADGRHRDVARAAVTGVPAGALAPRRPAGHELVLSGAGGGRAGVGGCVDRRLGDHRGGAPTLGGLPGDA